MSRAECNKMFNRAKKKKHLKRGNSAFGYIHGLQTSGNLEHRGICISPDVETKMKVMKDSACFKLILVDTLQKCS